VVVEMEDGSTFLVTANGIDGATGTRADVRAGFVGVEEDPQDLSLGLTDLS